MPVAASLPISSGTTTSSPFVRSGHRDCANIGMTTVWRCSHEQSNTATPQKKALQDRIRPQVSPPIRNTYNRQVQFYWAVQGGGSVSCCIEDAPTVFGSREVKARKKHTCIECGYEIQPGECYRYSSGLWDGSWSNHKQCCACYDLTESLSAVVCVSFHGLFEALSYWLDDDEKADSIREKHKQGRGVSA